MNRIGVGLDLQHLNAQLRQAHRQLAAREGEIRSDVRSGIARLQAARQTAQLYRDELLPVRERIVAETQKHYNYMLLGAFQLLQAKREEVEAAREYLEAVTAYWIAFAELERAVGGRLPLSEPPATNDSSLPPTEGADEPSPHHHHGGDAP